MSRQSLCIAAAALLLASACGSSSGGAADARTSGGGADGGGGVADARGGADGGGGAAPDAAGATAATLTGTIREDIVGSGPRPLPGATVLEVGSSPTNQTMSAADGAYSLKVPSGVPIFVRASATGFAPLQSGIIVPSGGATLDLTPVTDAEVILVAGILRLNIDAQKGIVVVEFHTANTAGGLRATLSAAHDPSFAFNSIVPAFTDATFPGNDQTLVFPNVATGTTTVMVTAPEGQSCALSPIANHRVDAGVMTRVVFNCS